MRVRDRAPVESVPPGFWRGIVSIEELHNNSRDCECGVTDAPTSVQPAGSVSGEPQRLLPSSRLPVTLHVEGQQSHL